MIFALIKNATENTNQNKYRVAKCMELSTKLKLLNPV